MLLTLKGLFKNNEQVTATLPNMVEYQSSLDRLIDQVLGLSLAQQQALTSISSEKNKLRARLVDMVLDTSRKIHAYAVYVKDESLQRETKMSESNLKVCSDIELVNDAQNLVARGTSILAIIAPYGINESDMLNLKQLTVDFAESIPQVRKKQVEKQSLTKQLGIAFAEADKIVSEIDALVEIVHKNQPTFYANYKASRRIVDLTGGSITAKGKVVDAVTGNGLSDVSISFHEDENLSEPVLEKETAKKGGFLIKSLDEGVYTVVVEKIGYKTQTLKFTVTDDAMNELIVKMEKN